VSGGSVVVAIKAVDQASTVFNKIQASMGILGNSLSQLGGGFGSLGNVISAVAAGGVMGGLAAGIGEVTKGLQWSVSEAAKSEQAIKNLSVAVEKSGISWDSVKEGTTSALSQLQKFTVYSDEEVAGALQKLLSFGLSYDDAMKSLGATVDFAAAKQMDLESAATLVGKAMDGNTAILKRYGVDIETSKDATQNMKSAFDQLGASVKSISYEQLVSFGESLADLHEGFGDVGIKGDTAAEAVKTLIASFEAGKLPVEAFIGLAHNLGVDLDATKLSAGGASDVLAQLNTQFGGTAQEQAKTYAGTQERLKNAMSDLGEKIGGMVLPALAGMTEAMIPVVDWFGKGVDQVQNWITAVGKMPEVKAATDALGNAFQGLQKWFGDVANTAMEMLGPALSELWDAFKEIGAALSPLIDAFGGIWAALTSGEGSGNMLKDVLGLVADSIKLIAVGIRGTAPYIKMLAEAFKAAAEFITPALVAIRDAVGGFLSWLHGAFEGFYKWLVGGSMWQEMWGNLLVAAGQGIANLIGSIGSGLIEGIKNAFVGFGSTIAGLLTGGIQGAVNSIGSSFAGVSDTLSGVANSLTGAFKQPFAQWQSDARDATFAMAIDLRGKGLPVLADAVDAIGMAVNGRWGAVWSLTKAAFSEGWQQVVDTFTGGSTSILNSLGTIGGDITNFLQGAAGQLSTALTPALGVFGDTFKKLSDTLGPIISGIGSTLATFFGNLTDWFTKSSGDVGDIWSTLWNDIIKISQGVGPALLTIVGSIFTLVGDAFTLGMGLISGILTTGFSLTFGAIQTIISTGVGIMTGIFQPFVNLLDASKKTWSDLLASITTNTDLIKGKMNEIIAKVRDVAQQMIISWTATMTAMQNITASAFDAMVAKISEDVDRIIKRLEDARNTIATHSIWPDMLSAMVQQSEAAMADLNAAFASGLTGPSGVVTMMGNTNMPAPQAQAGPTYLSAEVPIRNEIILDGEQISTIINRNQIRQRQLQRAAFA